MNDCCEWGVAPPAVLPDPVEAAARRRGSARPVAPGPAAPGAPGPAAPGAPGVASPAAFAPAVGVGGGLFSLRPAGFVSVRPFLRASITTSIRSGRFGGIDASLVTASVVAPEFVVQPVGVEYDGETPATLIAIASGTGPLHYQWFEGASGDDSTPVVGGTSSTLNVAPDLETDYWCRATGPGGTAESDAASVTLAAPTITLQPVGAEYDGITPVTLTVAAAGPGILAYQWQEWDGDSWEDVPGETGASFEAEPAVETDYRVVVSNDGDSTASGTATVTLGGILRLLTLAAFVLDFPRGSTTAFTTATGSTPSADTGFVRSVACEKAPAGAGTRIVRDADEFTYQDAAATRILGAGVVRDPLALTGVVMTGATGNTAPGDFVAQTKWWLFWHGRLAGTSSDISIELFRSDTNNARLQLFYQPSTGTLRLHIHNGTTGTNRDYVVTNGAVHRFAAYYDGTDLHVWVDGLARVDYAGTGALGTLDGTTRFFRAADAKTIDLSALWLGKLDNSSAAQHMADIASLVAAKA